ncbi:MAG TPA: isochorismatase family cysteine hydrolase [Nitrososphaerales archaeon]|nr:isochorismatase family cysteine hydrolase [Nitrososphaerales archaeon]
MKFDFELEKTALLIIDMNKAFVGKGAPLEVPRALENVPRIKKLLHTCRRLGVPVIHVSHVFRKDGRDRGYMYDFWPVLKKGVLEEGAQGAQIYPDIAPVKGETVISKRRYSAWFGTDLDIVVRNLGVDTLIICGTTTDRCTGLTAYEAFMRDLKVIFPSDANATFQDSVHDAMLTSLNMGGASIVETEGLIKILLEKSKRQHARKGEKRKKRVSQEIANAKSRRQ